MPPRIAQSASRRITPVSSSKSVASSPGTNHSTRHSARNLGHEADRHRTARQQQAEQDPDTIEVAPPSSRELRPRAQLETVDEEKSQTGFVDLDIAQDDREESQSASSSASSSMSVDEVQLLDRSSMITGLNSLYSEAKAVLALFQSRDPTKLRYNIKNLSDPTSMLAKKLVKIGRILADSMSIYVANPSGLISIDAAGRNMGLVDHSRVLENEIWRAGEVLRVANLATTLSTLSRYAWSEQDTAAALRMLTDVPDTLEPDATMVSEKMDLMLEVRTQLTMAFLRTRVHEDNFDPDDILEKVFLPADDTESLAAAQATRIQKIREHFSTDIDDPIDLDSLEKDYPWQDFLVTLASWTYKRCSEVEVQLNKEGGIETLQEALEAGPLLSTKDPAGAQDARPNSRSPSPPVAQPKVTASGAQAESQVQQMSRLNERGGAVQSTGQAHVHKRLAALQARKSGSTVNSSIAEQDTPPSAQPLRKAPSSSQIDQSENPAIEDDGIPDFMDFAGRGMQLSQGTRAAFAATKRQTRERNKENLQPMKGFNVRQPGAVRESWGEDFDSPERSPRKRARVQETDDDDDDFESDLRPSRTPIRRRTDGRMTQAAHDSGTKSPASSASSASQSQHEHDHESGPRSPLTSRSNRAVSSNAPTPPARSERASKSGTQAPPYSRASTQTREHTPSNPSQEDLLSSTQAAEANRLAKLNAAKMRAHQSQLHAKPAQTRIPWSTEEVERLIDLIEKHSTSWARLLEEDAYHPDGALLQARGQVGLKDKARNLKMDWLKARMALPAHFERVALGPTKIDMLRRMGVAVGEREI